MVNCSEKCKYMTSFLHIQLSLKYDWRKMRSLLKYVSFLFSLSFSFWMKLCWKIPAKNKKRWTDKHETFIQFQLLFCSVGWGCRIHRLQLGWGVTPTNEFPGHDTKQSNGEVPGMMGLWGMWSTPSLLLLPVPLWPGVVASNRVLSMG